jgi:hypothetical protein
VTLAPPSAVDDAPATPQLTPHAVELPGTSVSVDPRAPLSTSPAPGTRVPVGDSAFPAAPAFPALLPAAPHAAAAIATSPADGSAQGTPSQSQPLPGPSGASASAGAGSGVAAATLFALLVSLAAFGLRHSTRLRLPSIAWRQQAFLAVIERPG